jgi:hypothetical protein
VLDSAVALGAIPDRFAEASDEDVPALDGYFALTRGDERRAPLAMTMWLVTNYHYLVPGSMGEQRIDGSVRAFRLATASADTEAQIHTYLCYPGRAWR